MKAHVVCFGLFLAAAVNCGSARGADAGNPAATPKPHDSQYPRKLWFRDHDRQRARAEKENLDLIFIGDSITFMWHPNGQVPWKQYYALRKAAFFGIPGDCTENILWRVERCNLDVAKPKVIVLLIGANNLVKNHSAEQIAEGIQAIVEVIRKKTPKTHIIVTGILPRYKIAPPQAQKVDASNTIVKKLDDGRFVHVRIFNDKFLAENGQVRRDLIYDGVHMTSQGYEAWATGIEPDVSRFLGDEPKLKPQEPAEQGKLRQEEKEGGRLIPAAP